MEKKRGFITIQQKEAMLEYLKKNPDLVSGKFSSTFSFKDATKKWVDLTNILNSIPGCKKDWQNWRKTWQDMRSRTKSKISKNRNHLGGTGGGPFIEDPLSKYEEEILDIIKIVSVEGHNSTQESIVDFNFNNNTPNLAEVDIEIAENNIQNISSESNVTGNVEIENLSASNSQSKKLLTPKKIPKRRTKSFQNSSTALDMFQKTYNQKLSNKENYSSRKLELLDRIAVAKERSANAKERIANAKERIADVLENINEAIQEFL